MFVFDRAFDELIDRLGDVRRSFGRALLIGCGAPDWPSRLRRMAGHIVTCDAAPLVAAECDGVASDEDRLSFADASFDLAVAVGSLDGVDDLPGALLLLRRVLRPGGLFVGAMSGAGSLPVLRDAMLAADALAGGAAARIHPAIDVRTAGDLLARAGFALPVVDRELLDLRYARLSDLVRDLRAHGATNILARRPRTPLGRTALAAAQRHVELCKTDERFTEQVEILYLSGWAPAPTQPRGADAESARTP